MAGRVAMVVGVAGLASGAALAQGPAFEESFDSYAGGVFPCATPACVGPGGWGLWYYDYGNGPRPGAIVSGNAHSGTKAVRLAPYTDIIKRAEAATGVWEVRAWTYFPSGLNGPQDAGYFILLNECYTQPPIRFSLLLLYEGASGSIKNTLDQSVGSIPMIRDRWVETKVVLDLTHARHSVYYDGEPFYVNRPYGNGGAPVLECVAMYSDGVEGMLFDSISVRPPVPACYANCDSSTTAPVLNIGDFQCFMSRYAAGDPYANCDGSTRVPALDISDFTCFLQRYAAGCP